MVNSVSTEGPGKYDVGIMTEYVIVGRATNSNEAPAVEYAEWCKKYSYGARTAEHVGWCELHTHTRGLPVMYTTHHTYTTPMHLMYTTQHMYTTHLMYTMHHMYTTHNMYTTHLMYTWSVNKVMRLPAYRTIRQNRGLTLHVKGR
jgi:hypothetical protein